MMKTVIYARVSGDDSKYATSGIESQLDDCRKYCADKGYEVVGEYYEEPNKQTSGADWLPEIEQVMNLAQAGGFSVLVVRDLDRLSRDLYKMLGIANGLEAMGVRLEVVMRQYENSESGVLHRNIDGVMAEHERKMTRRRTMRGRCRSVDAGNVMVGSCPPYGYDIVKENDKRELVIDEAEAVVVRLIFDLYVSGNSMYSVTDYLSERQIPKPSTSAKRKAHAKRSTKAYWESATIRDILKNETYAGRWYYRKVKRIKVAEGKYKRVTRPREEWIMVEVPAIVSNDIFETAQKRRKANKRQMGKQHKHFYLVGGMSRCGHCGRGVSGITKSITSYRYVKYVCNVRQTPKRYGFKCDLPYFKESEVESVVWAWVRGFLFDPEALAQAFEDYRQNANMANAPLMNMIDAIKRKARDLEVEKARLVKAYTKGVLSLDEIAEEKATIEKALREATQATVQLENELCENVLTEDDIKSIQDMAAVMREEIDMVNDDKEAQRDILCMLDFSATFLEENGEKFLDVSCVLGDDRLSASQVTS